MNRWRLLLVADHVLFREGLAGLFAYQDDFLAVGEASVGPRVGSSADLTTRELEVLELVAARLSNKEIASRLVISEHTVKNHLKNSLGKLHLRSRRVQPTTASRGAGSADGESHPSSGVSMKGRFSDLQFSRASHWFRSQLFWYPVDRRRLVRPRASRATSIGR